MAKQPAKEEPIVLLRTWITEAMQSLDMKQAELAQASDVDAETIRLLMKKVQRPHPATLRGLERAFGLAENALDDVMAGHKVPIPTRRPPKTTGSVPDEASRRMDAMEAAQRRIEEQLAEVRRLLRGDATP